ncbi:MAG: c-type cytochrome [Acidobacteriota bacterium]|nr:c-type cytochrome [Acidobacteriota bacterium]
MTGSSLTRLGRAVVVGCVVLAGAGALKVCTQTIPYAKPPDAKAGKVIFESGCIACHGANGSGAPETMTVFERRYTFPDMTKCDQTTPEPNSAYKTVIIHGGPVRAFSPIMPAFGQFLTNSQVDDVVAYIRTLCDNRHHFPRGELNLPRALITEKAFPENEVVVSTAMAGTGAPNFTSDIIREQTFGGKYQIETDVPVNYADQDHKWTAGTGDISIGLKRELFSSLRTGSIFSVQGGVVLPSGDEKRGFGAGTTQFEPFAAYDQLFPQNTWLQFQIGADLPVNTDNTPRSMYWRSALGQSLARDNALGKLFSPMVEFVAKRDFSPGAKVDYDVVPQMQMTISRRQHVRADIGVRQPFTDTAGRDTQVEFYVLWDWADGKLWDGWK